MFVCHADSAAALAENEAHYVSRKHVINGDEES
jgi:hypothetical protein